MEGQARGGWFRGVAGEVASASHEKAVGKTTLATALCDRLAARQAGPTGRPVVVTKEPTEAFDLGNEELLHGVALAEAIAEDQFRHIAELIGPALADGATVVCDRYILSSYAFHTADGVRAAVIARLNRGFPRPALNLVLEAGPGELRRRRGARGSTTRLQAPPSNYGTPTPTRSSTSPSTSNAP